MIMLTYAVTGDNMSLLLILIGLGTLTISAFIFVLKRSDAASKNSLIHDAKLRSKTRTDANRAVARGITMHTEPSPEPAIPGISVTITDELSDAQHRLVKLIFSSSDDSQHK